MLKVGRNLLAFLITPFMFLWLSGPILAEETKIELNFEDSTLSAVIKGAPLRAVIEEIKKEQETIWIKIWLRGSKNSLDEKVSVQFKGLPVHEGIDRIFSMMNYSLIFDKHNKLLGVFLLGKPARGRIRRGRTRRRPPRHYVRQR
jgi:hypothetical protein